MTDTLNESAVVRQLFNFHHPVTGAEFAAELDVDTTIRQLNKYLVEQGFLRPRDDYQYIVNDRLCLHSYPLRYFIPDPAPAAVEVYINAELAIFA